MSSEKMQPVKHVQIIQGHQVMVNPANNQFASHIMNTVNMSIMKANVLHVQDLSLLRITQNIANDKGAQPLNT